MTEQDERTKEILVSNIGFSTKKQNLCSGKLCDGGSARRNQGHLHSAISAPPGLPALADLAALPPLPVPFAIPVIAAFPPTPLPPALLQTNILGGGGGGGGKQQ